MPKVCISWRSVKYLETFENCIVTTVTNIPCHCYIRYSLNVPLTHKVSRTKRGLSMMDDYYFCFTAYKSVEQDESGDTLEHTFSIKGWEFCVTYYFYFIGRQGLTWSISCSPCFKHHNNYRQGITELFVLPSEGGTTIKPGVGHFFQLYKTQIPLLAQPAPNYEFWAWYNLQGYIDNPSKNPTFITMRGDAATYPIFNSTILIKYIDSTTSDRSGFDTFPPWQYATAFIPNEYFYLHRLDVALGHGGVLPFGGDFTLSLVEWANDTPGNLVASWLKHANELPQDPFDNYTQFFLDTPVKLTGTQFYALILTFPDGMYYNTIWMARTAIAGPAGNMYDYYSNNNGQTFLPMNSGWGYFRAWGKKEN
jgi:hypothetical protein